MPHENVVAEYSFIVIERKKERERETKGNEEFSSPMLKYEMDEKVVRQQVTNRGKREKERKFLPQSLRIKIIKSSKVTKKERRAYLLKVWNMIRPKAEREKERKENEIKEKEKRERERERKRREIVFPYSEN